MSSARAFASFPTQGFTLGTPWQTIVRSVLRHLRCGIKISNTLAELAGIAGWPSSGQSRRKLACLMWWRGCVRSSACHVLRQTDNGTPDSPVVFHIASSILELHSAATGCTAPTLVDNDPSDSTGYSDIGILVTVINLLLPSYLSGEACSLETSLQP
jgi:hypothetical protein